MASKGEGSSEEPKYLICQKTGKKIKITNNIKCLKPKEPCKFRLECPIYIAWKSEK